MLRLPPFELLQPATLAEALELKKQHGEDAMYTSGGTDLYPNMKRRQFEPQFLIALKGIEELSRIEIKNGIRIGAGVSLDKVANHPFIQEHYTALSTAAGLVSSPQLRKWEPSAVTFVSIHAARTTIRIIPGGNPSDSA